MYSYTKDGQVIRTVEIKELVGQMANPGDIIEESENGRMQLKSGLFMNAEATGKEEYNVQIHYVHHKVKIHGVVSEDGKKEKCWS